MSRGSGLACVVVAAAAAIAWLPGCGGGSSGSQTPATSTGVKAESEPDDTTATATPFVASEVGTGEISSSSDVDQWSFHANAGALLDLEVYAVRRDYASWDGFPSAPRLELRAPSGRMVGQFDYQLVHGEPIDPGFVNLYLPESGKYTLRVIPFQPNGVQAGSGAYLFTSALSTPTLVVATPGTTTGTAVNLGSANQLLVASYDPNGPQFHFYKVTVAANEVLRVEVFANRSLSGGSPAQVQSWDPALVIRAPDGTTPVRFSADGPTLDSQLALVTATAGAYFIRLEESSGDLVTTTAYTMAVTHEAPPKATETEPNGTIANASSVGGISAGTLYLGTIASAADVDFYRIEASRGDLIAVEVVCRFTGLTGSLANAAGTSFSTIPPIADTGTLVRPFLALAAAPIYVRLDRSLGIADYALRYTRKALVEEAEPNGTTATATPLLVGASKFGTLLVSGDVDHWSFLAQKGATYVVTIEASSTGTGVATDSPESLAADPLDDVRASIASPSGAEVVSPFGRELTHRATAVGWTEPTHHAQGAFTATSDGTHVIRIDSVGNEFGSDRVYTVRVDKK